MVSRIKNWEDRNKKFAEYVKACDVFLQSVAEVETLVDELGSDPLNILDLLRPIEEGKLGQGETRGDPDYGEGDTATEEDEKFRQKLEEIATTPVGLGEPDVADIPTEQQWLDSKKEQIATPEWWGSEAEASVALDSETQVVEPKPADSPITEPGTTWQKQVADKRTIEKIQKNVNWLYQALVDGPVPGFEIRKQAEAAGISEYALLQARRSVSDIKITTVGYQGTRYWHLEADKHKLPSPISLSRKFDTDSDLTDPEQKILDMLQERGATSAELVGRTKWTPEKVKVNTQKLSMRKLIKQDRNTMVWTRA